MISFLIFVFLLTLSTSINKSLPECLSDCYYILGHWFTLLIVLMAFTLLPSLIDYNETYQFLAFLTCISIIFVGMAGEYKDKFTFPIHRWSAIISATCGLTWCSLVHPISLLWLLISILGIIDKKHWLYWIEVSCFTCVYDVIL